jgi:O-antigen ligase
MFAELGIFGGISFVLMYCGVFNLVYRVYKESNKYKYVALAFIIFGAAYMFQNLSNNLVFIPQLNVFVWMISGLLYKGLYIEKWGDGHGNIK